MFDNFEDTLEHSDKFVLETARIRWHELQYFFARGQAIYIAPELDLVDVAQHIANDDTHTVERWMQAAQIAAVNNDQARDWYANDVSVWAVVIKPWVLVQQQRVAVANITH
jgi:hypothetical protein